MSQIVFLFGIHHRDQRPHPTEPRESLRKRLYADILSHEIDLVGEEDDPASCLGRSIADEVAESLALSYVNLDPDRDERKRHGIPEDLDDAGWGRVLSFSTQVEQQAAYCDELRKLSLLREPVWLEKLSALGEGWTSMLLVCGAGHIASFRAELQAVGFGAVIVEPDWSSDHSRPAKNPTGSSPASTSILSNI